MIASLPMYLRAENRAAHEALWALIRDGLRARGIAAPEALDHDIDPMAGWSHPDLVLGHICNLPYRACLSDRVTLIGAADYGLDGAAPGYYYSHFVVRAEDAHRLPQDFAARRFAFNEPLSCSGFGAPQAWAMGHDFQFSSDLETGAHLESARAVAEGRADIAAIDAVSWRMLERWEDYAAGLRVIGRTAASPGMSFITAAHRDRAPYFAAIDEAIAALPDPERAVLGLRAIVPLPASTYEDMPITPAVTRALTDAPSPAL